MFTGIIGEVGTVESARVDDGGARIRIAAELADRLSPGDSVAVDGACLTAASVDDGAFEVDAMRQTLDLTTTGSLSDGDGVNLELALAAGDRLGGHVVSGHVDGVGEVIGVSKDGIAWRLRVRVPEDLLPYLVARGSVALAGVSLTVAETDEDWLEVSLIPETVGRTNLGTLEAGDAINVECDLMARHLRRLLETVPTLRDADTAE